MKASKIASLIASVLVIAAVGTHSFAQESKEKTQPDLAANAAQMQEWVRRLAMQDMKKGRIVPSISGTMEKYPETLEVSPERGTPLYEGDALLKFIPPDYPERRGYVKFSNVPADESTLVGEPFPDNSTIHQQIEPATLSFSDIFESESWAGLPPNESIHSYGPFPMEYFLKIRAKDAMDPPSGPPAAYWQYPVGTEVIHRILLKSAPKQVYEIRVLRKLKNGTWAYRIYNPIVGTSRLMLRRTGVDPIVFSLKLASGQQVTVRMYRRDPQGCLHCHFGHSEGRYQYADTNHAGPCGFVPKNESILKDWAPAYKKLHKYDPIVQMPSGSLPDVIK